MRTQDAREDARLPGDGVGAVREGCDEALEACEGVVGGRAAAEGGGVDEGLARGREPRPEVRDLGHAEAQQGAGH